MIWINIGEEKLKCFCDKSSIVQAEVGEQSELLAALRVTCNKLTNHS